MEDHPDQRDSRCVIIKFIIIIIRKTWKIKFEVLSFVLNILFSNRVQKELMELLALVAKQ